MGVLNTNRAQITSGGLISSSFMSDLYDVLTAAKPETIVISGSSTNHGLSVSGSLNVSSAISASFITGSITGNVTGNLTGTASLATTAVSSTTSTSSSFATTAISSSFVSSTLTFQSSTLGTVVNGALAVSSSGDLYFGSASSWHKVTLG